MLLNASLNNHRRNDAICESISSYLGKKERLACSSIPSNQAAMKKHHSIIIIDFWSLLDLIESSSLRSRSLLRKQRRAGWSFWSPQSLIKLHAIPSLLTWRYYYGRGSGRRDRLSSQDLARGSLDVVERREKVLVKEDYQVHLSIANETFWANARKQRSQQAVLGNGISRLLREGRALFTVVRAFFTTVREINLAQYVLHVIIMSSLLTKATKFYQCTSIF